MGKKTTKYKTYPDGSVYHINFGRTFHPELKDKHLGILFTIKSSDNMVLCLPLTSPKEKHFKSIIDFQERNYNNLKYPHLYYIKETDSIVLMEQFRTISKNRIESQYKNPKTSQKVIISELELNKIKVAYNKFFQNIMNIK